jgi:predicted DNA-binding transcriptional regulator AlpA
VQVIDEGGNSLRQEPHQSTRSARPVFQSAAQSARPVLNLHGVAELLGVSERRVHEMRAAGLLPEPIQVGPRALRWFRDELLSHLAATAPRGGMSEPAHLARSRSARGTKAGA